MEEKSNSSKGRKASCKIIRDDMTGYLFNLIPLPIIALIYAICFLGGGMYLFICSLIPVFTNGFTEVLSHKIIGFIVIGAYFLIVGLFGVISCCPPKLLKNHKGVTKVRGIQLLSIGMSTVMCCITVHFLAVNSSIIFMVTKGVQSSDGKYRPWYPSGREISNIMTFELMCIGCVLFYLGSMNILMSLIRRMLASRGYRSAVKKVWKTQVPIDEIKDLASFESVQDIRLSSQSQSTFDEYFKEDEILIDGGTYRRDF